MNDCLLSDSDGNTQFIPRFVDQVVWRISRLVKNNTAIHSLHCWDYTRGTEEQFVHTWKDNLFIQTNIIWPAKSRIFLVRQQLPINLLAVDPTPNPFKYRCCMLLFQQGFLAMPTWYESWKLPEAAGQPPELLARWTTQHYHWNYHPQLSEDGQYAAFAEPWGDERLAMKRGKALGKANFQAEGLFNLFRSDVQGIQFINTSTGRVQHHFVDKAAHHSIEFLQGNRFLTWSLQASPEKTLSLKEIEEGAADRNRNVYSKTFIRKQRFFVMTPNGIQEMPVAEELQEAGIQFYSFCGAVYGMKRGADFSTHYQLSLEGDRVMLLRSLTVPSELGNNWAIWFGDTNQCLRQQLSSDAQWCVKLQHKWEWMDTLLHKLRPYLRLETETAVVEQRPGTSLQHVFAQTICHDFLVSYSCLYLMHIVRDGKQPAMITLNAYSLPLQLYSPWCGRAAGLMPVLLLMVYLLIRRRGVRG